MRLSYTYAIFYNYLVNQHKFTKIKNSKHSNSCQTHFGFYQSRFRNAYFLSHSPLNSLKLFHSILRTFSSEWKKAEPCSKYKRCCGRGLSRKKGQLPSCSLSFRRRFFYSFYYYLLKKRSRIFRNVCLWKTSPTFGTAKSPSWTITKRGCRHKDQG